MGLLRNDAKRHFQARHADMVPANKGEFGTANALLLEHSGVFGISVVSLVIWLALLAGPKKCR